jgi:hypothetical protein
VKDHAAVQESASKPVVLEEARILRFDLISQTDCRICSQYGWLTDPARLQYLNKVSNVSRIEAVGAWQQAAVQTKMAGDMFWQLGVDGLSFGDSTDVSVLSLLPTLCFAFSQYSGASLNRMASLSTCKTRIRRRPWSPTTRRSPPPHSTRLFILTRSYVLLL